MSDRRVSDLPKLPPHSQIDLISYGPRSTGMSDLNLAAKCFREAANRRFFQGSEVAIGFEQMAQAAEELMAFETRLTSLEAKVDQILELLRTDGEVVPKTAALQTWNFDERAAVYTDFMSDGTVVERPMPKNWRTPIHDPNGGR